MRQNRPGSWCRFGIALPVAAAILVAGCGGPNKTGPPMGDVSGTITYQGKPVANATIIFVPTAKGMRPAVGVTNGSGKYGLSVSGEERGAIAGPCQVTIALRAPYDGPIPDGMSPAYAQEFYQNQGKSLIPEKYASAQSSGLSAEVKTGRNVFDFTLQD